MSKIRYIFIAFTFAVILLGGATIASASFNKDSWQFYRELSLPNTPGFVKLTLPSTISRGANNFADVRVITTSGIEVPYFLTKDAVRRGGEVVSRVLDQTVNNGSSKFILDTNEISGIHTGMILETPSLDYRRQVKIYSSKTLIPLEDSNWNIVTDKGYIFRFTDPNTAFSSGKNSIDFPSNTARYLKVVIEDGPEGSIKVTKAKIYGDTRIDIPSYNRGVSASVFNNPDKKTTEVTLDLGDTGNITNTISISSTDNNYNRRVIVESTDDIKNPSSWKYVGQGSISNITTSLFTGSSNQVSYPEQKTRFIRLSIVNDDNRPIAVDSVARVDGPIISLIFETRIGEYYRLYYGNSNAYTPTYDLARISSYIETNKLPQVLVGSEITNTVYVEPKALVVPYTESHKWPLNTLLIFVVIIIGGGIGWYLYRYMGDKKPENWNN